MQEENVRYILNPSIKIIKNKTRDVLYMVDDFFHFPDNVSPLTFADSIFLLLFDGTRTEEDIKKDFIKLFKVSDSYCVREKMKAMETHFHISPLFLDSKSFCKEDIEKYGNRVSPRSLYVSPQESDLRPNDLRLDAPLSLNYNVSTSCAFKCEYCYHPLDDIKPYIPLERLKVILKEFKDNGCESVMLTGGDPLLRPDIDEIIKYLHEIDLFYALSTKSILSDKRIDKLYEEAGFDRIQISLDSSRADVVESLVRAPAGYFDSCIHQIEYMMKKGLDVRLKAVLTSYNAPYLEEYLSLVNSLGVKNVQIVSYGRSGHRHKEELFASEDELKKASDTIEKARVRYPEMKIVGGGYGVQIARKEEMGEDIFSHRAICNAGRFSVTMLPNGEVTICEQLSYDKKYIIGDLNKEGLMEWWNGERVKEWLSPPKREIFNKDVPCFSCEEETYRICHSRYSRCLRYCNEYFGESEMPYVHCPKAAFKEFRIV